MLKVLRFLPYENGDMSKTVILKVSDFRSETTQGRCVSGEVDIHYCLSDELADRTSAVMISKKAADSQSLRVFDCATVAEWPGTSLKQQRG